MNPAGGIHEQAQVTAGYIVGVERMGLIRRLAELRDRQPNENMAHGCIADGTHFVYPARLDLGLLAEFFNECVDAVDDRVMKLGKFSVVLGIGNPANDIVAELGLRIEGGLRGPARSVCHVEQLDDDGRRADIYRQTEDRIVRIHRCVFLIYIGLECLSGFDSFGENTLLEESGTEGDGHG